MDEAFHGEARGAPELEALERVLATLRRGESSRPAIPEPLQPGDVEPWPAPGSARARVFAALGEEALRRGEVGSLVLAGGAAAQALVSALGEQTFLAVKLHDARRAGEAAGGRPAPVAIMTSVLTQEPIDEAIPATAEVLIFRQRMLPRLTRGLEPWTDREGRASLAPAGNGDVFRALRDSGVGAALLARGVRTVLLSSVDDLAATLDPVALGAHLALDQALTVEVTARRGAPGTLGEGAGPARLGGRVQLVEPGDPAPQPLVATGSLWLDLGRVLAREVNLPWRLLATEVDGDAVLQLEQLTGDVTALEGPGGGPLLPAAWLEVPRRPAEGSRSGDVEPG